MTFKELLQEGVAYLKKHHIADADIDAWQLMEFVWGINRSYYFGHSDDIIKGSEKSQYLSLIHRRAEREPLQHITNRAYFAGHEFYVNKDVLIPRFDTETLVAEVLKLIKSKDEILDICTGSGCIIITLMLDAAAKDICGTGVDISAKALAVAKRNAKDLKADVHFVKSDLLAGVAGQYNIIVSNPPYIESNEIDKLMVEVKDHEPMLALDGKNDGLYFYRKIVSQSMDYLKESGYLAFEIGYNQGEDVANMMMKAGYKDIRVIKDLSGHDRVVIGQK